MCMLGTFSQYSVISEHSAVKVDPDLPLDKVVLIGCGVPTGFGSAVHAAATEPGDTIAIYGIGGIGINAVQGAALAGARNVVAIDPLANKREAAEQFGATHSCATAERGAGADHPADPRRRRRQGDRHGGRRDLRGGLARVQRDPQGRHGGGDRAGRPDEEHDRASPARS